MRLEPVSFRLCVRLFTLSNMNVSETSCPIKIKFYLENHLGGGLTALGHSSPFIFDWFFFILAGNEDIHKISNGFEFSRIKPGTYE